MPHYAAPQNQRPTSELEIKLLVSDLICSRYGPHPPNLDLVAEVAIASLGLAHTNVKRKDVQLVLAAVNELLQTFLLFNGNKQMRRVAIFGSSRITRSSADFQMAEDLSRKLCKAGFGVITGIGEGIMQAVSDGAELGNSIGAKVELPWEESAANIGSQSISDKGLLRYTEFFAEKLMFSKYADAIIVFPGGYATLDELYEFFTLIITGKIHLIPVILIEPPGRKFWKVWDKNVREQLLRTKLIQPNDLNLYLISDNNDEAVKIVIRFYRNFHSYRFVGDYFGIRLSWLLPIWRFKH